MAATPTHEDQRQATGRTGWIAPAGPPRLGMRVLGILIGQGALAGRRIARSAAAVIARLSAIVARAVGMPSP